MRFLDVSYRLSLAPQKADSTVGEYASAPCLGRPFAGRFWGNMTIQSERKGFPCAFVSNLKCFWCGGPYLLQQTLHLSYRFVLEDQKHPLDLKAIDSNCSFKSTALLSLCPASKDLPQPWRSLLLDPCLDLEFPTPRASMVCDILLLNGWVSGNLGTHIHMRDNFLWFFKNVLDQS